MTNQTSSADLTLIRGIPGSGKSTMALEFVKAGWVHFEVDMFMIINGVYSFNEEKLYDAHEWCEFEVGKALSEGKKVVVSNVFPRAINMQDYFDLAEINEIEKVKIIHATGEWQDVHNTPKHVIELIRYYWENLPICKNIIYAKFPEDVFHENFTESSSTDFPISVREIACNAVLQFCQDGRKISKTNYKMLAKEAQISNELIKLAITELFNKGKISEKQVVNKRLQKRIKAIALKIGDAFEIEIGPKMKKLVIAEKVQSLCKNKYEKVQVSIACNTLLK